MVVEHLLSDRNFLVIGISDLKIIWILGFEILGPFSEKQIYSYLSQL
jgi:hypothetical protein